MSENRKIPTPEEIASVKGLGFLIDKTTGTHFNARVLTVNGKITADKMIAIAEASKKFGSGEVAFTTRQTAEVQHIAFENIPPFLEFLKAYGLETGGTGPKVRPIVSCKGTTCRFGLIDTYGLSEKIHEIFYKGYHEVKLPHKFKIAVGGCPNNCVKPDLNDLGVVGQKIPKVNLDKCKGCKACQVEKACPVKCARVVNGKITMPEDECNSCGRCVGKCPFGAVEDCTTGYRIYIGGRWGKRSAQGRPVSVILQSEDEVIKLIESAILLFRDKGEAGERFADTVARIGFDAAEKLLVSDELILRKSEILAK